MFLLLLKGILSYINFDLIAIVKMTVDVAFILLILAISGLYLATNYIADKRVMLYFMAAVLIVFSSIKDPLCLPDMGNYLKVFKYCNSENQYILENVNVGYMVFNKILRTLTGSFILFVAVVTIFNVGLNVKFIEKYSEDWNLSILIYLLVLYFYTFFILRQAMAMSVGLIAYRYILERKLLPFCITWLVAVSLHSSAVAIFPLYFIYGFPMDKKGKIILIAGAVLMFFSLQIVSQYITSFQSWYHGYSMSNYAASYLRIIQKVFFLVLYIYALGEDAFKKNINFLVLLFALTEVVLYLGSQGVDGIFRLRLYFDVGEIIGLPLIYKYLKEKVRYPIFYVFIYVLSLFASCFQFLASANFNKGYQVFF